MYTDDDIWLMEAEATARDRDQGNCVICGAPLRCAAEGPISSANPDRHRYCDATLEDL